MKNIDSIMEELHPGWVERKKRAVGTRQQKETKEQEKEPEMTRHRFVENEDANSAETTPQDGNETIEQACGKIATACEKVIKRRRRTKAEIQAAPSQQNMYTMSVVGAATLADYPLQPGEKLVIAKLTPIHVVKGAL